MEGSIGGTPRGALGSRPLRPPATAREPGARGGQEAAMDEARFRVARCEYRERTSWFDAAMRRHAANRRGLAP